MNKKSDTRRQLNGHQSRCPKRKPLTSRQLPALIETEEDELLEMNEENDLEPNLWSLQPDVTNDAAINKSSGSSDVPNDDPPHTPEDEPLPEKRIRKPRQLLDFLPSDPRLTLRQFITMPTSDERPTKRRRVQTPQPLEPSTRLPEPQPFETEIDEMGLFRRYKIPPSRNPDHHFTIHHVSDAPTFIRETEVRSPLSGYGPTAQEIQDSPEDSTNLFFPFLNGSVFRLMTWYYSAKKLTLSTLNTLVHSVILAPTFKREDFEGFNAFTENKRLDDLHIPSTDESHSLPPWLSTDKWRKSSVHLPLPLTAHRYRSESHAPTLQVDFYHRDFVEAFKSGVQDVAAREFHWRGYELYWKPSEEEPAQRVYGEVYTSNRLLRMEEKITPVEGCHLESAVVPLLLYSDGTQLANFGTASLWPIYFWFGGLSKYTRGKPTSFSANHLAYLPSVPDLVKDKYNELFGKTPTPAVITFLRRELIQAVWNHILSDEFKAIYKSGLPVKCGDGTWRRLYPRFFGYSAGYKERVLVSGIKDMGTWLDVTCRIMKKQLLKIGTKLHDIIWSSNFRVDSTQQQSRITRARKMIFEKGFAVNGKAIDQVLGESVVPVRNAFSSLLLPQGENYYDIFVRDIMHEFELGVWKGAFTHLIRMLYTYGAHSVAEVDRRYRQVSPFGRDTIRRIRNDASSMSSLAARDLEDLVQVAGPCFEGLFRNTSRSIDSKIQDLLFTMACWHASAKMRLHTEWSLDIFRGITRSLTQQIRIFARNVCPQFQTRATPKEAAAETRRKAANALKKGGTIDVAASNTPKIRSFHIDTPKTHSLVHYPASIEEYGTTDSVTTQIGEQEHIRSKEFYQRTNKNSYESQIAQHERRGTRSRAMQQALADPAEEEILPDTSPEQHHFISNTRHQPLNPFMWAQEHQEDPATKVYLLTTCPIPLKAELTLVKDFVPKLMDHLISRLQPDLKEITDTDRGRLIIRDDMIFEHKTLRINYTTYDNRREQDTINPKRHSDVMFLSNEDDHPYWYYRIVKIFHAMVRLHGQEFQRIEFLWGRWYGFDYTTNSGFAAKRMHQIGFVEGDGAFDFTDPKDVLRAVHLIPQFAGARVSYLLGPSIARREDEGDQDYERYFVNMFVDRDMFVRFTGGGIGHRATREATRCFMSDVESAYQLGTTGSDDSDDSDKQDERLDDEDSDLEDSEDGSSGEDDKVMGEEHDVFDDSLGFGSL
ncbi:hypothetical protein H0H93_016682 [Arthromyces matolae]|nr:hypothetical protein H0H93_016682 [Arthromyces matolae]